MRRVLIDRGLDWKEERKLDVLGSYRRFRVTSYGSGDVTRCPSCRKYTMRLLETKAWYCPCIEDSMAFKADIKPELTKPRTASLEELNSTETPRKTTILRRGGREIKRRG